MEEEKMLTTTTSTFLPQEIVMEILSRLPAKSLVCSFKLVCKAWCTLIQDPDFIEMHLLNRGGGGGRERRISSNNNNNNNHHSLICKSGKEFFQLYPPFNFEGIPPPPPPIESSSKKLDFDLDLPAWSISRRRLVGSCNGLLCLSAVNADVYDDENIILLNPSTRRYKISAPIQPIQYLQSFSKTGDTYGFGCCYNPTTNIDEYKVVRIFYFVGSDDHGQLSHRSQVDVYCMSSNSWRTETKIRDFAFSISSSHSGVFVNEALHWVVTCCTNKFWGTIASFDIRDEEFGQLLIPLPCSEPCDEPLAGVILMNMKGCLSMIRPSHGWRNVKEEEAGDLEVWVMKEYGIKESWTKEFVIRSWDTPSALSNIVISSWISSANVLKGDQILMERFLLTQKGGQSLRKIFRKLVLYDINKRKINGDFKMIGVRDEYNEPSYPFIDLVEYIETLVSLKSSIMAGVIL